jgi:hypothetical protein
MSKRFHAWRFSMSLKQIATLTLICLLLSPAVVAQVLYGSLTGNVTDPSGAVVADAKVTAVNVNTNVTNETTVNGEGVYRFQALLPGIYKVAINAANFATQVTENVNITVNTVVRVDGALKLAQTKDTVTVTSEAPLLQADKADVHTDLTAKQIDSLPITSSVGGRNFQNLLRIVPGFGNMTEQNSAAGNPQRAMSTNVNGQSLQGINTRIDGTQDAYPWLPGNVAYVPGADAVETVNVVTNSFDPEQGMAGGAAVNVQIKSGTNQFHGTGFEFFTDHNLRTRNYFQTPQRLPEKPKNIKQQYGGSIGGPIVKDKLFFFGDYQRTTQRGLGTSTLTLPTTAMRSGDFSSFIPAGQDCNTAATKTGCVFDPTTGQAFPGNIIPTDRIDPASKTLVGMMPAVTSTATINNYQVVAPGQFNVDNFDIKVNYVPSQKSTFFTRYSMSRSHIFDPPSLGALAGDATNGGQLGDADSRIQSVGLGGTRTFSPTVLMDWNLGFTRQRLGAQDSLDLEAPFGLATLGITGTNNFGTSGNPQLYYGIPFFQVVNTTATAGQISNFGNANTANPFLFRDNQYVGGINLSWIHGKHAFRFGAELNHTQMNHFQPQGADGNFTSPRGSFNFNGNLTAVGTASNPANSFAQFLLGLPNRAGKAFLLNNPVALRWWQYAWYARDQWQVNTKLTLTLGVRWEIYPFGYSDQDRGLAVFDPSTGNVLIGGKGGIPKNDGVDTGSGQFLPRIGLAYRLTNKTVIRAGYGMSADPNNYHFLRNAYPSTITGDFGSANASTAILSLTGTNAVGNLAGVNVGLQPALSGLPLPDTSSGSIPLPNGAGTRTWPLNFRRGYINSFNFTVQQEIAGFSLEGAYVGTRGIRPLSTVNINAAPVCPAVVNGVTRQVGDSALCTNNGFGRPLNVNGHSWAGINEQLPFGNNYYDSLQAKLMRRFSGGSLVGVAYTFSKTINFTENEDLSGLFEQTPALQKFDRALASFDRPHNLQVYGIYELPFGHGKRWANGGIGNAIGGGWQLNTIVSRLSGTPFSVTGNANFLNPAINDGLNATLNMVGTYHVLHNSKPWTALSPGSCPLANLSCHYFDPAVFAQPALGQLGNTARNQFRGPGIFDADISIFRNFKMTERFTFQFRAEMFGLTNTPRFNNPNTSCGASGPTNNPTPPATPNNNCASAASTNNFGAITATNGTSGSNSSTDGTRTIWFSGKLLF